MMRRFWIVGLLLVLGGCGSKHKMAPVSGRITIDGQPAGHVRVSFEPIGSADNPNPGPGSFAETDEQGRFTLATMVEKEPGAVIGRHRVRIMKAAGGGGGEDDLNPNARPIGSGGIPRELLPPRYNFETKLTFDVPPQGTTEANFDVSLK